jgi:hypothetical protein
MNGCDCWGPDDRLDTKINQFDFCHIQKKNLTVPLTTIAKIKNIKDYKMVNCIYLSIGSAMALTLLGISFPSYPAWY